MADPHTSDRIGLKDTSFYVHGPDGLLLELVNSFDPAHPADTVLSNYRLSATGIYTIEIHSVGLNSGGYTLIVETNGIKSSAAATATRAAAMTLTQAGVGPTLTAIEYDRLAHITPFFVGPTETATMPPPT